jgi:hypothetical protein
MGNGKVDEAATFQQMETRASKSQPPDLNLYDDPTTKHFSPFIETRKDGY